MTAELFSVSATPSPVFSVVAIFLEVPCAKSHKMSDKSPTRDWLFVGRDRSW
jgi:hypothetical protein